MLVKAGLAVGGIVLLFVLWDLAFTSAEEQVEEATDALIALGNAAGEDAVAAILDALDADYRGGVPLSKLESYLENYVGGGRIRSVSSGGISPFEKDGEWHVNLMLFVDLRDGNGGRFPLAVSFVEREDGWRVIDLSRTWLK